MTAKSIWIEILIVKFTERKHITDASKNNHGSSQALIMFQTNKVEVIAFRMKPKNAKIKKD